VFAEGTRSRDGSIGPLRSGAAVLAAQHELAIVPVHVSGTHTVMPPGRAWMHRPAGRRHPIAVRFGAPVRPADGEHRTEVMERVRRFFEDCGAQTTPDKRIAAGARKGAGSSA
jgi:1-acyl-sn-glycerol-3-phosphate acyltransferase